MGDIQVDKLDDKFLRAEGKDEQAKAALDQLERLFRLSLSWGFTSISKTLTSWKSAGFALPIREGVSLLSHYLYELESDLTKTKSVQKKKRLFSIGDDTDFENVPEVGADKLIEEFSNLKAIVKNYAKELGIDSIQPSHAQLKEFYYSFSNLVKTFSNLLEKGKRFEENPSSIFPIYEALLSFPESMYPPEQSWK